MLINVGHQLVAANNSSCYLHQLVRMSCGKQLEMYCYILSGCCANFIIQSNQTFVELNLRLRKYYVDN